MCALAGCVGFTLRLLNEGVALMLSSALGRDEVRQRVRTAANLIAAAHMLVPSAPGAFSAPLEIWCDPRPCNLDQSGTSTNFTLHFPLTRPLSVLDVLAEQLCDCLVAVFAHVSLV